MIFWDMDGVLVKFNEGAYKLIKDSALPVPAEDDWYYLSNPVYRQQVEYIASSGVFWRELNPNPVAVTAFNSVKESSMILSSPGFAVSATPKLEWCRKHLGIKPDKVVLTPAKHLLAGEGDWPIDDCALNCHKFCEAGGRAILVEYPYSYKHGELTRSTLNTGVVVASVEDLPTLADKIITGAL